MKYLTLFVLLAAAALNVLAFSGIESGLVHAGFSWTWSKALPYATLVIIGLLIGLWVIRHFAFRRKWLKFLLFIFAASIPFLAGFAIYPIYEGDFSSEGISLQNKPMSGFQDADLVVIAIPGCPYCHASIDLLETLKGRNPKMRIRMVVCSSDPESVKPYRQKAGESVEIVNAEDPNGMADLAGGRFPSFVLVRNDRPVYRWSNDQFGAGARDKLEDEIL